jgi:hypothetical protein
VVSVLPDPPAPVSSLSSPPPQAAVATARPATTPLPTRKRRRLSEVEDSASSALGDSIRSFVFWVT